MKQTKIGRREAIAMLGAAGAALAAGCSNESPTTPTLGTTTGGTTNAACAETPAETNGPFPSLTDLIRSDIREGKNGTPLTLTITVVNTNSNCSPVENAAGVYASRGSNPTSNTQDNIFADSINSELATVSGDPTSGITATFRIGIAA